MKNRFKFVFISLLLCSSAAIVQAQKIDDSSTLLHLTQSDYDTPYGILKIDEIVKYIDRIYNYQSSQDFLHQLIDWNDSYLNTSATSKVCILYSSCHK